MILPNTKFIIATMVAFIAAIIKSNVYWISDDVLFPMYQINYSLLAWYSNLSCISVAAKLIQKDNISNPRVAK